MATQDTAPHEIDPTYHEAQPPRMVDSTAFPPTESLKQELGRTELGLDDVIDPDFPWQVLAHDSPGGKKRVEEIKKKKAQAVQGYVVVHSRFWQQFRTPEYLPGAQTRTYSYTVGRSRSQSSSVEAGIEVALGLEKGIFKGELKGSLKWTTTTEQAFSESETRTVEQQFEGDCWYFYWQTMNELTVFRREKASPDALVQAQRVVAPSSLVMIDRFKVQQPREAPAMRLGAGAVTLKKGQSKAFGGYVFASTKVSVKNLSNNDDGELTLSWMGLGGRIVVNLGPGSVKHVDRYLPVSFNAIDSGVTELEVWTAT